MFSRLVEFMRRPVAWGAVLLSYVGIIAAVSYAAAVGAANQDAVREEARERAANVKAAADRSDARLERERERSTKDFCTVVINVHDNAKLRLRADKQQLASSRDYLKTGPDADLRKRVRQTLPLVKDRVKVARANVRATTVPPTCKPYLKLHER